jgi:hypothetical protein
MLKFPKTGLILCRGVCCCLLLLTAVEIYPGPDGGKYQSDQYSVQVYQYGQWAQSVSDRHSRLSITHHYFTNHR